jgi:DNA-binding response OmpR family regulator
MHREEIVVADPAPDAQSERHRRPTDAAEAHLNLLLAEARQRFTSSFADECDGLSQPIADLGANPASLLDAVTVLHRMAGVGGTFGFPRVSVKAGELEEALTTGALSRTALPDRIPGLRAAFALDVEDPLTAVPSVDDIITPLTILLVEDEPVQRAIISAQLRTLGHTVVTVASGEEAVEATRLARPDAILLDIELPGIDGYAVCQLLKADPDLAAIPVAFLSAHGTVDDRLTGLSLGAADFLIKPVDRRELALRLMHLDGLRNRPDPPDAGGLVTYERFQHDASEELQRRRCALALIRTPADPTIDVAAFTREEIRRRDLCGQYDGRVVVLMPDLGRAAARDRIGTIVESCRAKVGNGVYAGVTASDAPGERTLPQLMEEAVEALAYARTENLAVALRPDDSRDPETDANLEPMVLVADDDPDMVRLVDAHLAIVGYRRILAFDGSHALELIRAHHPDVVVLDLMMPRLTGFDVLSAVQNLTGRRPHVIVVSARGHEDTVMRAFSLGVDDFMLKPFNPHELLVRISRLLKGSAREPRLPATDAETRA